MTASERERNSERANPSGNGKVDEEDKGSDEEIPHDVIGTRQCVPSLLTNG
jgi:hypothetical protein